MADLPTSAELSESAEVSESAARMRRFLSAEDFRARRTAGNPVAPRDARRRTLATPRRRGPNHVETIRHDFGRPLTLAFVNPESGSAKTTSVLAASSTFGTLRAGGVVAWDSQTHLRSGSFTEELGIHDVGAMVRAQVGANFDLLGPDQVPPGAEVPADDDFEAVHTALRRFYRLVLVDTGSTVDAKRWRAASQAPDLLVVTSTVAEASGYAALKMLDGLEQSGQHVKYESITVLSDTTPKVDAALAADLVEVFGQRTRSVVRIPFDPALSAGRPIPHSRLARRTQNAWINACAVMAGAL